MREIKFRAKSLDGIWEYGDLLQWNSGDTFIGIHSENWIDDCANSYDYTTIEKVDPDSVGQFTGLHDKNGKEIYEGDIIQRMYIMDVGKGRNRHVERAPVANDTPKVIDFRDGAFGYVNFYESTFQNEEWLPLLDEQCEVIGNIHDNPELLKGGEK